MKMGAKAATRKRIARRGSAFTFRVSCLHVFNCFPGCSCSHLPIFRLFMFFTSFHVSCVHFFIGFRFPPSMPLFCIFSLNSLFSFFSMLFIFACFSCFPFFVRLQMLVFHVFSSEHLRDTTAPVSPDMCFHRSGRVSKAFECRSPASQSWSLFVLAWRAAVSAKSRSLHRAAKALVAAVWSNTGTSSSVDSRRSARNQSASRRVHHTIRSTQHT